MAIYSFSDPKFFDKLGSEGMEWVRTGALEVGWDVGAVALRDDPDDDTKPVAMIASLPAGASLVRHAHAAHRVEILLKGSLITPEGQTLTPGDVQVSRPGEAYGPNTAGPEGAVTIEIIGTVEGIPALLPDEGASEEDLALVQLHGDRIARHRQAAKEARAAAKA